MSRKRRTDGAEAKRLVDALIGWGLKYEEIAYRLRISMNTIIRWRKGRTDPQPGHLDALRLLHEEEARRRKKSSAVAA